MIVRSVLVWIFATVYWAIAIPVYLLSFRNDRLFQKISRTWAANSLKILNIQLLFENESTLEDRRARVVIVNHQSGLDLIWGAAICPPAPLAIGKREVAYIPIVNLIWWALGFIRIDRRNTDKALESLRGVGNLIVTKGRSLMIAPEGTRSPDGTVGKFKKGAFHMAAAAETPIYPVVVQGAFELLPKGRLLFKPGVVRMRYLPPVSTVGWTMLSKTELEAKIEAIRQDMIQTLEAMSRRAHAV